MKKMILFILVVTSFNVFADQKCSVTMKGKEYLSLAIKAETSTYQRLNLEECIIFSQTLLGEEIYFKDAVERKVYIVKYEFTSDTEKGNGEFFYKSQIPALPHSGLR